MFVNFTLVFYPTTPLTKTLVERAAALIDREVTVEGLRSEEEIERHMFEHSGKVFGYVVFEDWYIDSTVFPRDCTYQIRLPSRPRFSNVDQSSGWGTGSPGYAFLMSTIRHPEAADAGVMYHSEGFILIQAAMASAFATVHGYDPMPSVKLKRYPIPATVSDPLKAYITGVIIVYSIAFLLPTISMTQVSPGVPSIKTNKVSQNRHRSVLQAYK